MRLGLFKSGMDAPAALNSLLSFLVMQGFGAKISEREQGGRTIHRVRLGPFDSQADAASQQERLKAGGVDAALVRQERNP